MARKRPQETIKRINKLYKDGNSVNSIAEELGISYGTVYRYLPPQYKTEKIEVAQDTDYTKLLHIFDKVTVNKIGLPPHKIISTFKGSVTFANESFFTVKGKNYYTSFMFSEIKTGEIEVTKIGR